MVSKNEVTRQLKALGFNSVGWGRSEISELPNIILPDEEIYECVNGMYVGGFALLVATNVRVLLVDRKPLSFLTVEDMRYDMISEMDYSHRLFGADINISSGDKTLHFKSYNKPRLRKLIGHVQHCIADNKNKQNKHQDSQVSHLEQINKQLQAYLIAQHQYQMELQDSLKKDKAAVPELPSLPKPSNELADYLYAQSLLKAFTDDKKVNVENPTAFKANEPSIEHYQTEPDLFEDGVKEVFGGGIKNGHSPLKSNTAAHSGVSYSINPSRIAFSKLPMALRERRFGKTSSKLINLEPGSEYSL